jgi:hypothetical protein
VAEVVHHRHPIRRGSMAALSRRLGPDLVAAGARDGAGAAPPRRPGRHPPCTTGWRGGATVSGGPGSDHTILSRRGRMESSERWGLLG